MAYIAHDYEKAEQLTLEALLLNPEMYQAHSLLSEIHAARGDKDKALSAAWNGAHTRPRDTQMWSRIARLVLERDGENRRANLRDAIYCYNRIISVDKTNVEARYQRAALNRELGHKRKVVFEYEQLIKQLPHDTTVLRHLAEIYIELNEPDQALRHYEATIAYFQAVEPDDVTSFTWSDVNIVAELYGFQQRYDEAISMLKSLARWLLGRRGENFWETFEEDDREWDLDDQPRRVALPDFVAGAYEAHSYGGGLPLELRIKLGIFRLYADRRELKEAIVSIATCPASRMLNNASYRIISNGLNQKPIIRTARSMNIQISSVKWEMHCVKGSNIKKLLDSMNHCERLLTISRRPS